VQGLIPKGIELVHTKVFCCRNSKTNKKNPWYTGKLNSRVYITYMRKLRNVEASNWYALIN